MPSVHLRALAAILTTAFILAAGVTALPAAPTEARPAALIDSVCGMSVTNTLVAGTFDGCSGEVALSVEPYCPVCPGGINVVFIQHSKAPQSGWQNEQSARAFDMMLRMKDPDAELKVGVIHYNESSVRVAFDPTGGSKSDVSRMRNELRRTTNGYEPNALNITKAARDGVTLLRKMGRGAPPGSKPCEFVVIFGYTKSHYADMERAMLDAADILKRFTYFVGCPQIPGSWYCRNTRKMARSAREHTEYSDSGKLEDMTRRKMSEFDTGDKARTLTLSQLIPTGLDFVPGGSASLEVVPEVESVAEGTQLTWIWNDSYQLESSAYTATYKISSPGEATAAYTLSGSAQLIDSRRRVKELPMPDMGITMSICVTPTPTPTDTPTPTPTDTPVPTATPTNTLTPTPSTYVIYLPISRLDPEECIPELIYADAVLVLDMSTSMYRETRSGRTKHQAALAAARTFVEQLTLDGDVLGRHDRVGIAGFNDTAWTATDLSSDGDAIDGAIESLLERIDQGTRLDLALQQGQAILDASERIDDNKPILILLTDGLPNRVPLHPETGRQEETVLDAATAAKEAGTRVFTIGLGDPSDVAHELLEEAASSSEDFYYAPDGDDLEAIYRQIAGRITECPEP